MSQRQQRRRQNSPTRPHLTLNGRRPRGYFGFAVGGVGVPLHLIDRDVLRKGMMTGGPLLFLFVWAWLRVDRSISSTQSNIHNPHTITGARRRGRPPSYAAAPVPWSRRPTPHATVNCHRRLQSVPTCRPPCHPARSPQPSSAQPPAPPSGAGPGAPAALALLLWGEEEGGLVGRPVAA